MEHGPVALQVYDERRRAEFNAFTVVSRSSGRGHEIRPKGDIDFDHLSEFEIEKMSNLVEIYARHWVDSKIMSDESHKQIRAWRKTYRENPNALIDFADELIGVHSKDENELSPEENAFLVYEALTKVLPANAEQKSTRGFPLIHSLADQLEESLELGGDPGIDVTLRLPA